jgi:TolB-like protein
MIGTTIGHYRILELLGEGGMGEVYLAEDLELARKVALKFLPRDFSDDPQRVQRFRREAKTLASLDHPNIVTIHSVEQADGVHFITMQRVEGSDLKAVLGDRGLPRDRFFDIAIPLIDAVAAAHERGVTHRDLKPANVMVTPQGRIKVLDFGLAKVRPAAHAEAETQLATDTLTQAGVAIGTVSYMSPEQAVGKEVDHRSDVFSLGILLYEMATGQRPFRGDDNLSVLSAILKDHPDTTSALEARSLPRHLGRIIEICLQKDPERRYQSAKDIRNELTQLQREVAQQETLAEGASAASAAPPAGRLQPRWLAAAGAVLAVAAIAFFAVARRPDAGGGAGGGVVPVISLVALPSQVLGEVEESFLTDAIPSTLSTHLSRVAGLETKVSPTHLEVEQVGGDLDKIAAAYHVNNLIVSRVIPQGERLVLNVQVVEIPSRRLVWSQEFEGERSRYLDLARDAAEGIRLALLPAGPPLAVPAAPPTTSEAELALRRGVFLADRSRARGEREDFDAALGSLTRAFELDPRRAEAPAEIGRLHASLVLGGVPAQEVAPQVRTWARRALDIDSRSGRAWAVLSEAEQIDPEGDYARMLDYALKAAAFGPQDSYAHTRLGYALSRRSFLFGLEASRRAIELEPLALTAPLADAISLSVIGRTDEAHSRVEEVLALEPEMPFAHLVLALVAVAAGDGPRAMQLVDALAPLVEQGRLRADWLKLASDYAVFADGGGDPANEAAQAAGGRLVFLARGGVQFPRWESATGEVAPLLARHGRFDEAMDLLLYRGSLGLNENYEALDLNPDLKPLRSDGRFIDLLRRSEEGFEEMRSILLAARAHGDYPAYLDPLLDAEPLPID